MVRAIFVIEALVGNAEPLHGPAANEVLLDNGLGVFRFDVAIPDGFRVDNHRGSVFALVKAAGLVDAHLASQSRGFGKLLQPGMQVALSVCGAGGARGALGAGVVANKDVVLECGQA